MTDLVPGALILRFLLAPDDLVRVGIAVERRLVLLAREGIELLDADQGHFAQGLLAALLQQIEIHLAAAKHDPLHLLGGYIVDLADHAREAATAEILERGHRQLVAQQTLGRHDDERLAERLAHLPPQHVEHLRRRRRHAHLHVVFRAQLQETLEARRGVFRPRPFVAMRQQQHQSAEALPLGLAGADELIDDHLGTDQFISSGEAKWERFCGLVLLLPHGYEGAGPEHSSARLNSFLQLCAENNMQVCVPSTPAQMFHMLRRQMRQSFRKPLIVMTPKSLLRHELSVSSLEDLSRGGFARVIGEVDDVPAQQVQRIVFCSGKVYFDLLKERRKEALREVALVRIEQLYPFPSEEYQATLNRYPNANEIVWCQEEPQNQGAWYQIRHRLQELVGRRPVLYAGRRPAAAPATGIAKIHEIEQQTLVAAALRSTTTEESARETTRLTAAPAVPAPSAAPAPPAAPVPATPIRRRS